MLVSFTSSALFLVIGGERTPIASCLHIHPDKGIVLLWPSVALYHLNLRNEIGMACVARIDFVDLIQGQKLTLWVLALHSSG